MELKIIRSNELYHHGIEGQKWGIRRYQNSDGSLTEEGIKRYTKKAQGSKYSPEALARIEAASSFNLFGVGGIVGGIAQIIKENKAIKSQYIKEAKKEVESILDEISDEPVSNLHISQNSMSENGGNRETYKQPVSDKTLRITKIASVLGGPIGGSIAGLVNHNRESKGK